MHVPLTQLMVSTALMTFLPLIVTSRRNEQWPGFLVDPYSPIGLPRSISPLGPEDQFFISVQPSPLIVSKHYLPQSLPDWVPGLGTGMGSWRMVGRLRATRGVSLLLFLLRTHGHVSPPKITHSVMSWRSVVLFLGFCPH